jgi:hypothetical protein
MTITVTCDGLGCPEDIDIDLEDGSPFEDYDIIIEKALASKGWYNNMDGDYCKRCTAKAKEDWSKP